MKAASYVLISAVFILMLTGQYAQAQGLPIIQYEVTSSANSGSGTLRGALDFFNTYTGPPWIVNCEVYFAQDLNGATITVSGTPLEVQERAGVQSVTIKASNLTDGITLSGGGSMGVLLQQYNTTLNLEDVTIENGYAWDGAGILNNGGLLRLRDCTIKNCHAIENGGGMLNGGTVEMQNVTFYGCTSGETTFWGDGGAAILNFFDVTMNHCTITSNSSGILTIGDMYGVDTVKLANTIVSGNGTLDVRYVGDGVPGTNHFESGGNNLIGLGNAVDGSTFIESGDTNGVSNPQLSALADNGGPTETCLPMVGSPAVDGAPDSLDNFWYLFAPDEDQRGEWRGVGLAEDIGAVEMPQYATVTSLADSGPGSLRSAISNALNGITIIFDPVIDGQTILLTGGHLELAQAQLKVDGSTLVDGITVSADQQSRIFKVQEGETLCLKGLNICKGKELYGGGVFVEFSGHLIMKDCSVFDCSVSRLSPEFYPDVTGGGICNLGSAYVENSTFSGNDAQVSSYYPDGGAIFNGGLMTLVHCTVTRNRGGILSRSIAAGEETHLRGCVVSGNEIADVSWATNQTYFINNYGSFGNNIIGTGNAMDGTVFVETGDQISVTNPGLGRILYNGGPVLTCMPESTSPVIDSAIGPTISNTDWLQPPLNKDQRNLNRPAGSLRDIGAVERQGSDADGILYASYAAANGLAPSLALADQDHNANGVPDMIDYALWAFPDGGSSRRLNIDAMATNTVVKIPLPPSGRPDTQLDLQTRTNLTAGSWITVASKVGEGNWSGSSSIAESFLNTQHRQAELELPNDNHVYVRLRASELP